MNKILTAAALALSVVAVPATAQHFHNRDSGVSVQLRLGDTGRSERREYNDNNRVFERQYDRNPWFNNWYRNNRVQNRGWYYNPQCRRDQIVIQSEYNSRYYCIDKRDAYQYGYRY